jgi:hypothetical protein
MKLKMLRGRVGARQNDDAKKRADDAVKAELTARLKRLRATDREAFRAVMVLISRMVGAVMVVGGEIIN